MLLIKFGGSVISDKTTYKGFREDVVRRIAKVLPKKDLILVHGAGSFGHILAEQYRITGGFEEWKRIGFAKIERDMLELNAALVNILVEEEIPVVSVPPHAFMIMGEKQDLDVFDYLINYGFVPMSYGDAVFDKDKGINIYSGDLLMLELAKRYRPEKTIFLTDVDGIYNKPPGEKGARIIKKFSRNRNARTEISVTDVTGGMDLKIDVMKKIAEYSKVFVVNGFYPERIVDVINDRDFIGTVVE